MMNRRECVVRLVGPRWREDGIASLVGHFGVSAQEGCLYS
jgi:hypothetical protein